MKSKSYDAYDQVKRNVAHSEMGARPNPGKVSSDPCDSMKGVTTRHPVKTVEVRTIDPQTIKEQVGTNAELTWKRQGQTSVAPKDNQGFKKNYDNPTDSVIDNPAKRG